MNSKAKNKEKVGTKSIKKVALASNLAQQENKLGKSLNFSAKIGSETILGHFSISGDHRFEFSGSNVFFEKRILWSRLLVIFQVQQIWQLMNDYKDLSQDTRRKTADEN